MTVVTRAQLAFSAGEISPLLHRRTDYQRNQTGLARANGFLPLRQGGFTRAPGTVHDGATRNNQPGRLVDFEFSTEDAMILEFTPGWLRFWRYGQLVMDGASPYEIATPYGADSLPRLQWEQSADVIYLVDGLNPMQKLSRFALDDWTIAPVDHVTGPFRVQNLDEGFTLQASDVSGTITVTASADFFDSDLVGSLIEMKRISSPDLPLWTADVDAKVGDRVIYSGKCYRIVSFHGGSGRAGYSVPTVGSPPPASVQDSFLTWSLIAPGSYPERANRGLYSLGDKRNFGGQSWEVSAVISGSGKTTGVNPPTHAEGDQLTEKGGPVWRYEDDGRGVVRVDAIISPTQATCTVMRALPRAVVTAPTYRWAEGAWSARHGWPSCLASHDQRLIVAATPADPRTFWASVVGDYEDFSPGIEADDSFAWVIAGQSSLNRILWLASGGTGLHIGALGEEYSTRSSSQDVVIGPTTTVIGSDGTIGSRPVRPIVPDGAPMFISKDGARLFQISYQFESDRKHATELSLPADHLGASGFEEIVWQSAPQRIAWLRRGNGQLAALLHDPDEDVLGWAPCSLAGGFVESMAVAASTDGTADILTMIVRREIDGQTVRFVESQSVTWGLLADQPLDHANHAFAAAIFAPDPATDSFSLPHLAGETVLAWTDKGQFGPLEVAPNGAVTLPDAVNRATIGLFDDTHVAETLDITAAAPDGDTMARRKRLHARLGVGLHRTAQGHVRAVTRDFAQPERLEPESLLIPEQVAAALTAAHSGLAVVPAPSGSATEVALRFRPHGLAPMTITAVIPPIAEHGR